jgi:hypothetical protein
MSTVPLIIPVTVHLSTIGWHLWTPITQMSSQIFQFLLNIDRLFSPCHVNSAILTSISKLVNWDHKYK